MAYNDYGAFAYLAGERRRDREDVTLRSVLEGSYDPATAGGVAIYAHLLSHQQDGSATGEPAAIDDLRHAVIGGDAAGDGAYLTLYKWGFWAARLFYVEDGEVTDEMDANGLREALGVPSETEEGHDMLSEGAFKASFVWHGWTIVCELLDTDEAARRGQPTAHARVALADGFCDPVIWDAFCDSDYGAGLADAAPGAAHLFDSITRDGTDDGWPHSWRNASLVEEGCFLDDEVDDEGRLRSFGEGPEARRTWISGGSAVPEACADLEFRQFDGTEAVRAHAISDDGPDERYFVEGHVRVAGEIFDFSNGDGIVSRDTLERLLNVGIALGRAGIDRVSWGGDGSGSDMLRLAKASRNAEAARAGGGHETLSAWCSFKAGTPSEDDKD